MNYLIHGCSKRKWYIDGYLIPSLREQGIEPCTYIDNGAEGNLFATMNSFHYCGDAWHLQDDVVICKDFAKRAKDAELITCGFCRLDKSIPDTSGKQKANKMWFSFPCIYIPGKIAKECAEWFFREGIKTDDIHLRRLIELKKGDDSFFKEFIDKYYSKTDVINLKPNLVDHIDYLIGGSIANNIGHMDIGSMSAYFEDSTAKERLKKWLEKADHLK